MGILHLFFGNDGSKPSFPTTLRHKLSSLSRFSEAMTLDIEKEDSISGTPSPPNENETVPIGGSPAPDSYIEPPPDGGPGWVQVAVGQ